MEKYSLFVSGTGNIQDIDFPHEIHKGDRFLLDGQSYTVDGRQLHFELQHPDTPKITLYLIKNS